MSDSYFLRPDADGPALEMRPGVSGRVLLTTSPGVSVPHVVLDPSHVEEVCRVMYRYAGLEWPIPSEFDAGPSVLLNAGDACTTTFREGRCAGLMGHPEYCSVDGDGIPSSWRQYPLTEPEGNASLGDLHNASMAVIELLTEIRDRLPEPTPPVCGADNSRDGALRLNCELPAGHEGRHAADNVSWPVVHIPLRDQPASFCGDQYYDYSCELAAGHNSVHRHGPVSWPYPQIPRQNPPTSM